MGIATRVEIPNRLVAEYEDVGEVPPGTKFAIGEPIRGRLVAEYTDVGTHPDGMRMFTVLLHDGRVIAVRGHELKHLPAIGTGDNDSYGIIVRASEREELIALFKTTNVDGIFHGEMRVDRTVA